MTGILVSLVVPTTITALGFGASNRRTAAAAARRIHELLDTPVLPVPDTPRVPSGHRVEFDGVRFAYPGGGEVLRGIDLDCPEGTVTALVGPSGAGKSTLATLVARFHDVTGGAVRIGGVDVREIAPEVLYRHVGFVLQDVQLVHGSIADNVRLGRPDAPDEELHAACRAARIHERVLALPAATTPSSARTRCSPVARHSACRSPGPCSPTPWSWSSTRRPRSPTRSPRPTSRTRCRSWPAGGR